MVTRNGWATGPWWLPPALGALGAALVLTLWLWAPWRPSVARRVPGTDRPAGVVSEAAGGNVFAAGVTASGPGRAAKLTGAWPGFRGPARDGLWPGKAGLATSWGAGVPKPLWEQSVGEGFAGPAIESGRLFLMDYDREKGRDALRCLSLEDGREIWRYSYPMPLKRNHGLTRTVPAVARGRVVAMGPKGHTMCVEAETGKFVWGLDLAKDFGATVPPWYTGQCPLVDGDAVILAPGGDQVAMMAVSLETGEVRWRARHEAGWKMSHASIAIMELDGVRYYVHPASGGVLVVRASDGVVAWASAQWKINIATVPTPVILGGGRVFFTGGYNAGCVLMQFAPEGDRLTAKEVFRLKAQEFGATQHSPVWHAGYLYGVRADGRLVCLSAEGKVQWTSGEDASHGLGPVMVADGMVLALTDGGRLSMVSAEPGAYTLRGTYQVMEGHECWAPMAMADGRLLVRDVTRLVCLDVSGMAKSP
ncbi:MAG: PQQ-like beta-propeller repeat protein [Verrucomicrobiales bacterium]|nr:PQQ-like beta-propeller repeat protein [Verrucomicrobiales bacterium]